MLDTDVLIALEKGDLLTQAWFEALPEKPYIAGYAALELLAGCENAADRRRIMRLLRPLTLVWPDITTLDQAVLDFGDLRLRHGLGVLDMLIAVTALSHKQDLATFNWRHSRAVPGLVTVRPDRR